jgi:diguanylate cyclase (GGDEF)-like protein
MTIFASRYGRDLHGRKPIRDFLNTAHTIVDINMPLKTLSTLITSGHNNDSQNMFIITQEEQYRGVGNIMDLLRQITELQITSASYANPLSGLPGNVPISEYIKTALEQARGSSVCYVDLDNFKPYNDIYGYEKGDKVILETARILAEVSEGEAHFIGHVGGDDFIIIFENGHSEQLCEKIQTEFTQLHPSLYNEKHLAAKGIEAQDRHGNARFFPLLSLSIGMVKLHDFPDIKTEAELAKHASIAKSLAKKIMGNSLYRLSMADFQITRD